MGGRWQTVGSVAAKVEGRVVLLLSHDDVCHGSAPLFTPGKPMCKVAQGLYASRGPSVEMRRFVVFCGCIALPPWLRHHYLSKTWGGCRIQRPGPPPPPQGFER